MLRNVERLTSHSAPRAALELVHDASHVERVLAEPRETVEARPGGVDRPGTRTAALLAVGGLLEAVAAVVAGELRNAFVLARPPGHHAEAARPMGFCLLNATAVAARWAQLARGAARVAILDWDVHHGNGTEAIFRDDASVLTISLHQDRLYPYDTGDVGRARRVGRQRAAAGRAPVTRATRWRSNGWSSPRSARSRPDLLLIGAGQDAAASDPLGRMAVTVPGVPRVDRPRRRARRRVLRRPRRGVPRGRLLAAPPAGRQPRDPRGAGGAAVELPRGPGRLRHPARAARRRGAAVEAAA